MNAAANSEDEPVPFHAVLRCTSPWETWIAALLTGITDPGSHAPSRPKGREPSDSLWLQHVS